MSKMRMMRMMEDIIFILLLICVTHFFLDKFGIYNAAVKIIRERGIK